MTHEPDYGNSMNYAGMRKSALGKAEFTLEREVARRECSRGDSAQLERKDHKPSFVCASMNRLVAPDSLIPTDGKLKALGIDITGFLTGTIAKARLPMTTCSRIFGTKSRAQAGDGAMRCEPRTPSGLVLVGNPQAKKRKGRFLPVHPAGGAGS